MNNLHFDNMLPWIQHVTLKEEFGYTASIEPVMGLYWQTL